MFSRIRKRCTYANVTATLALFFAMTGGALAASHYLITSTKQIKPSVLSVLKGRPGAVGANGANGTNGAVGPQGPQGPQGSAGTNGAAGESVSSAALKPKEGGCTEGGSKFTVGGKETTVCNGKAGANGTTGFTEKLPAGKTETGSWSTPSLPGGQIVCVPDTGKGKYEEDNQNEEKGCRQETTKFNGTTHEPEGNFEEEHIRYESESLLASISFPIPLKEALSEEGVHYVNATGEEEATFNEKFEYGVRPTTPAGSCPGDAEEPKAAPGNLCVYQVQESALEGIDGGSQGVGKGLIRPASKGAIEFLIGKPGAAVSGAVMQFKMNGGITGGAYVWGTWAVAAPAEK
jgi:hypothetical protein